MIRIFAPRSHNIGNLLQGEHFKNSGGIGVGSLSSQQKTCNIFETSKIGVTRLLLMADRKSHTRYIHWCQNQWPWKTLKGHYALSKHVRLSEPTTWKIECQRRRCSLMQMQYKVYANIRGGSVESGVKRQWGNRKIRFSGLVIFSPLSPLDWPQNTWLEWPFYVQFSIFTTWKLRTAFQRLGYIFIVELFIEYFCSMVSLRQHVFLVLLLMVQYKCNIIRAPTLL